MAVVPIVFFLLWPISSWIVWSGTPAPSINRSSAKVRRASHNLLRERVRSLHSHEDRPTTARHARRMSLLFALDFQKRSAQPDFKKSNLKGRVVV
jgi:hypothetical protein